MGDRTPVEDVRDPSQPRLHRLFHATQRKHVPVRSPGEHRGHRASAGVLRGAHRDWIASAPWVLPGRVATHGCRHSRRPTFDGPPDYSDLSSVDGWEAHLERTFEL